MDKLDYANLLYEKYLKEWDISNEEYIKIKYAKEKKERDNLIKRNEKRKFNWKQYINPLDLLSEDKQEEIANEKYKQFRENI